MLWFDEQAPWEDPEIGPPVLPWLKREVQSCWLLINAALETTPEKWRPMLERSIRATLQGARGDS